MEYSQAHELIQLHTNHDFNNGVNAVIIYLEENRIVSFDCVHGSLLVSGKRNRCPCPDPIHRL